MLTDEQLSDIFLENQLLSEKALRNARERQKNVENESLEESLLFLGLADYAKLGKAYSIYYQLPYYPVFNEGIGGQENFPINVVQLILSLPLGSNAKQLAIVSCQPENKVCKSKVLQLANGARIVWRVASHTEINDAISKYYLKRPVKRENQEIQLPFDFKIIDFEITALIGVRVKLNFRKAMGPNRLSEASGDTLVSPRTTKR